MASSATAGSKLPPPPYHVTMRVEEHSRGLPLASIRAKDDALFEVTEKPTGVTAWKISFKAIPYVNSRRSDKPEANPFLTCYYPLDQMTTPYSHSFDVRAAWIKHKSDHSTRAFSEVIQIAQSYFTSEEPTSEEPKEICFGSLQLLLTAIGPNIDKPPHLTHMHFDVCDDSLKASKIFTLRNTPIMRSRGFSREIPFKVCVEEALSSTKKAEITIEGQEQQKSLIVSLGTPGITDGCIETTSKVLKVTAAVIGTDWEAFKCTVSLYSLPNKSVPTITLKRHKDGKSLRVKYSEVGPPSAGKAASPSRKSKKDKESGK